MELAQQLYSAVLVAVQPAQLTLQNATPVMMDCIGEITIVSPVQVLVLHVIVEYALSVIRGLISALQNACLVLVDAVIAIRQLGVQAAFQVTNTAWATVFRIHLPCAQLAAIKVQASVQERHAGGVCQIIT
jgi:hypothetical protein